jgi:hypothetical protein
MPSSTTAAPTRTIDPAGSIFAEADAINAKGQIIGDYITDPSSGHNLGFLDSGGIYTTIDPPGSHRTDLLSINSKGDVVGVYRDGGGVDHGFLLTTAPTRFLTFREPSTLTPTASTTRER